VALAAKPIPTVIATGLRLPDHLPRGRGLWSFMAHVGDRDDAPSSSGSAIESAPVHGLGRRYVVPMAPVVHIRIGYQPAQLIDSLRIPQPLELFLARFTELELMTAGNQPAQ